MYFYSHRGGVEGFSSFKHKTILFAVGITLLSFIVIYFSTFAKRPAELSLVPEENANVVVQIPELAQEKIKVYTEAELNKIIVEWGRTYGEDASLILSDENGNTLGQYNSDQKFFAASIYKLYVAYVGFQKIDSGEFGLNDSQWQDWTKEKCLFEMVANSHSPCAETMLAQIGRENLQALLESYGLTGTAMHSITTTAKDANIILGNIWNGVDISDESREMLLESMNNQKYRNALPNGFSEQKSYNKVGFRDYDEYHDVSVIELKDGRVVTLSVFTNKVGVYSIYQMASKLSAQLN